MLKGYVSECAMYTSDRNVLLKCCICGEEDLEKIKVMQLGLAAGMQGNDYSFCKNCWESKDLGDKILELLGYPCGLLLNHSAITIQEQP